MSEKAGVQVFRCSGIPAFRYWFCSLFPIPCSLHRVFRYSGIQGFSCAPKYAVQTVCLIVALLALSLVASDARAEDAKGLPIPAETTLLFTAQAQGVQIYVGKAKTGPGGGLEWTLKAPEATLFDSAGRRIGKHSAGPTWEGSDGSKVVGALKQRVDAPEAGNIPWLLLEAKSHEGEGRFRKVAYILRVDTVGGIAPARLPKKEGQEARVKYRATYLFLASAATP